ncbi:MAG: penicillin-binding protein 1C [Luteolibacter sp.]|uniref:penicillin-binding protein 1C n=1 Tax=Luteolibacter sp. TaxID=1962973 RepID=UPI003266B4D9
MRTHRKIFCLRCLKILSVLSGLLALCYACLPKPDLLPPDLEYSRTVLDRDGHVIFLTTTSDGMLRLPATLGQIAPEMLEATLEMEDRRFFSHPGVDGRSLLRAGWGVLSGKKLGGGSTLTMQLSRLRWGLQTRSAWGKCVQMFRAIQLERHYSKKEIAAAYFTIAPYGGNVEGVRAASFRWCGKDASELTRREAASLSAIPQSPTARRPRTAGNALLAVAQARLMTRLRANHGESPNELDGEFNLVPNAIPREAPHLARRRLREDHGSLTVTTSLDLTQQHVVEQSIRDFLSRWNSKGLRNASAILLHAPTGEIRASVGSADFHNVDISGQVDGTRAPRSPGSTLKPFIYALALDAGLIQPQTLLDDAPRRFAGYNPENSDHQFLGPIAASEALRRSRNIPAIELANRLPGGGLESFLRSSGVNLPQRSLGLALAIGATEMRLEDLAKLYAELAHPAQGRLSPEACWLTLDALRCEEPAAPIGLSCKTGTSNGFRDAWACGVMGDWVICVWVGHFNGRGMPGLFAHETAAPLLWQTVTRLKLTARPSEESRPPDVVRVPVCAVSGDLAGTLCSNRRDGWFIGGVSPITTCKVHQKSGDAVVEVWPADRLEQFRNAGFPRANSRQPVDEGPHRTNTIASPPRIVSPQSALTYYIQENAPQQNRLLLEANSGPDTRQIHWFADRRYLGASAPAEPLSWEPIVGDYEVQAMDDAGRVSSTHISVRLAVGNR